MNSVVKFFLLLQLLLCSCMVAAAKSEDISQSVKSDFAFIDFDDDNIVDDDELLTGEVTVNLKYIDFGHFGNFVYIEFNATNGKKDVQIAARYTDVTIDRKGRFYHIRDKDDKLLFSIENVKCYKNVVCIHDFHSFKLMEVSDKVR